MTNSLLSALDDIVMRFLEVVVLTRGLENVVAPWLRDIPRSHQTRLEFGRSATPRLSSARVTTFSRGVSFPLVLVPE